VSAVDHAKATAAKIAAASLARSRRTKHVGEQQRYEDLQPGHGDDLLSAAERKVRRRRDGRAIPRKVIA